MTRVIIKGWKPGLRKVELTKLLQARTSLSLSESKGRVDLLLNGHSVELMIRCCDAPQFVVEANGLGAVAEVAGSKG